MDSYVADAFQAARQAVMDTWPEPSRERSLVLTKIEEAELWCSRIVYAPPVDGRLSVEEEQAMPPDPVTPTPTNPPPTMPEKTPPDKGKP